MGFNGVMVGLLRSPFHRLFSGSMIVLGVTGVTSGRRYDVPVNYVPIETAEGKRLLVTSQRDRSWWRNLRERVDIELTFYGKRMAARAQVVEGEQEVAAGLTRYFQGSTRRARFFGIDLTPTGNVGEQDLQRLTCDRIVVWVDPSPGLEKS